MVLPAFVALAYGGALVAPVLPVLLALKVVENGTDYSLQKTAEQALFLVTTRAAKYKVKPIVDGVGVRLGDVMAALLVAAGVAAATSVRAEVGLALGLTSLTLLVSLLLRRGYHRRAHGVTTPRHSRKIVVQKGGGAKLARQFAQSHPSPYAP